MPKTDSVSDAQPLTQPVALLYGKPLEQIPAGLYIPPEALKVFLESFEGPLDLLLWLIRQQKFDVMDIPMALLTEQYMGYVELIRQHNLDLAGDYLVMAAHLMAIKSRLLLPVTDSDTGEEAEDPRAELMRRLAEYEQMKIAAAELERQPREGRDFTAAKAQPPEAETVFPEVSTADLAAAWKRVLAGMTFTQKHHVNREELSLREHMSGVLRLLQERKRVEFSEIFRNSPSREHALVSFLAILELAKEQLIRITQNASFSVIWVSSAETAADEETEASESF